MPAAYPCRWPRRGRRSTMPATRSPEPEHRRTSIVTMPSAPATAALGIGLGVLDLVAGVVILAANAGAHDRSVDGTSFAMTFIIAGVVLAVAARAADWNTHGPVAED